MPYDVYYLDTEFVIHRYNFEPCYRAIENYHRERVPNIQCPGGAMAFPEKDIDKKISYALTHFGWRPDINDEGIRCIAYGHNRRGDPGLLRAIARYVESGSNIELIGEDGRALKYIFCDGDVKEYQGEIVYSPIQPA